MRRRNPFCAAAALLQPTFAGLHGLPSGFRAWRLAAMASRGDVLYLAWRAHLGAQLKRFLSSTRVLASACKILASSRARGFACGGSRHASARTRESFGGLGPVWAARFFTQITKASERNSAFTNDPPTIKHRRQCLTYRLQPPHKFGAQPLAVKRSRAA